MERPCVAPLITPSPVVNATLISLLLFTRHGSRTATQSSWGYSQDQLTGWECGHRHLDPLHRTAVVNGVPTSFVYNESQNYVFSSSCHAGALLDKGFDQQESLGKLYRDYLINQKVLPEKYDPSLIKIRSSFVPRCVESAIGFMQGLYPPESEGEILNITTGNEKDEPLCPYAGSTPETYKKALEWTEQEWFKKRHSESTAIHNKLVEPYNVTVKIPLELMLLGDHFNVLKCNNKPMTFVDEEMYSHMLSDVAIFESGFFGYAGNLTYGPIWELIMNAIDRYYGLEEKARFYLFSGHDVTVSALLAGLGYIDLVAPPPYASHFAVEIWYTTRPHLRFVFNGDVVPVDGQDLVPLTEFKKIVVRGGVETVTKK